MNKIKDLFQTIESKIKVEKELKEIIGKLKLQANNMDITDLNNYSYKECRELFKQIQCYINDKILLNELSAIIEKKKIKEYPELLKPTYYPEIDSLDISNSEKLRLDKAARNNFRYYMNESNIYKLENPLSIKDLELLKSIGIVEREYNFKCENCGSSCDVIPEKDLMKYIRYWELFELEKQKKITKEQLSELDQLEEEGFYEIFLSCINCDDYNEIEITNKKKLSDYKNNVQLIYKVVKKPDLTYEKL